MPRTSSPRLVSLALALGALCFSDACGHGAAEQRRAAAPAVAALAHGDFGGAGSRASALLASDPGSSSAALVRAVTRYERAMHQLSLDLRTAVAGGVVAGELNQKFLTSALSDAESALDAVDHDLATAERDADLAIDLCVACMELDWNGNGQVDERDRLLFQIEQDAAGQPIPEGDARRKPTFRFDHGDVLWARAFVAFQRAAVDLGLAYDWGPAARIVADRDDAPSEIRLRLIAPQRVADARERLLDGLRWSGATRDAYLAETDDEREWVPNPSQQSHPLPLPVDTALYQTWKDVVGDLERLVRGDEGLSLGELSRLVERRPARAPTGYLDVGRMLSQPQDIVIDVAGLESFDRAHDSDGVLKSLFGPYYVQHMQASPLLGRMARMKEEVDRAKEPLSRKLMYLFWIN